MDGAAGPWWSSPRLRAAWEVSYSAVSRQLSAVVRRLAADQRFGERFADYPDGKFKT